MYFLYFYIYIHIKEILQEEILKFLYIEQRMVWEKPSPCVEMVVVN